MDKIIKNKLEKFQIYVKKVKNKKPFVYKFNNISLENGFELDYFSTTKKKLNLNVNFNYIRYSYFIRKRI